MSSFHLQVVTPDGQAFEGQAQRVFCRTITGDVCILPRHCDYMTALGMGEAPVPAVYAKALAMKLPIIVESETQTPDGPTEACICMDYLRSLEK